MRLKIKYVFLIVVCIGLSSFIGHKFYVSVTQIDQNIEKERLEITVRIFIDDLEKALTKPTNTPLFLATAQENIEAKAILKKYLIKNLGVKINNKNKEIIFLGSEYEDDVIICYLKVDNSEKIINFEFLNTLLVELFPEQQNLVHTYINKTKQSFLLSRNNQKALITQ